MFFGGAFERIEQLVHGPISVRAGMLDLVDLCAKAKPSAFWTRFYDLDFESDQKAMEKWLRRLLKTEPPPIAINGLWFGLFTPYRDGKPTSCLYLAGSGRFDPTDPDWACGPEYFPEGRYSPSKILMTIYREANGANAVKEGVDGQAEYTLCLGYSCLLIAEWCRGPLRKELLGDARLRGVAAGFDSGDVLLIDVLRAE